MLRHFTVRSMTILALAGGCLLGVVTVLTAFRPAGDHALPRAARFPIKHIIIVIKENHSFDNIFGTFPGADGATTALAGNKRVKLGHTPDHTVLDIGHAGDAALLA